MEGLRRSLGVSMVAGFSSMLLAALPALVLIVQGCGESHAGFNVTGDHFARREFYFGEVPVGSTKAVTLTITNLGPGDLTVDVTIYPTGFTVASNACAHRELHEGKTCDLVLAFAPAEARRYFTSLIIEPSSDVGSWNVSLLGDGVAAP